MATKKKTFEEKMQRIGEIVSLLERGEAPLEESLSLFEEGTKLILSCDADLNGAEQKVMKLTQGANGEPIRTPFATEED